MKRVISKIIALVLVFSLVFEIVKVPAKAADTSEKIPGIDYDKINMGTEQASMDVYVALGPYNAYGTLVCGNRLKMDEVNDIIRRKMQEFGITSDQLIRAKRVVKRAARTTDIDMQTTLEAMASTAPVPGLTSFTDFISMVTGTMPATPGNLTAWAGGILTTVVLWAGGAAAIPAAAVGVITSYILGISGKVIDFTKETGDAELGNALRVQLALMIFYDAVNAELENLIGPEDRECQLVFGSTITEYPVSFMNVGGNKMYFRAKGVLTKEGRVNYDRYRNGAEADKMDIFTGEYTGDLELEIWYDMSSFDRNFKDQVFLNSELPLSRLKRICNTIDDTYKPTVLKKTLTAHDFSIYISPKTQDAVKFSLKDFENKDVISIDHKVKAVPNKIMKNHDENGNFDFPYGQFTVYVEYDFDGSVSDGKYVDLNLSEADMTNNSHEQGPYFSHAFDMGKYLGSQNSYLMDADLYYFLRNDPYLCFLTKTFVMD